MRPKNIAARDRLRAVLGSRAGQSAQELAQATGVSVPTLHRMLAEIAPHILAQGQSRSRRYALRRPLRGNLQEIPIFRVDEAGNCFPAGHLAPVFPEGYYWQPGEALPWPLPEGAENGWWPGLPYPLYDLRPRGYMGRALARHLHRQWPEIPENPNYWTDDDILQVLQTGADFGTLLIGKKASWCFCQSHFVPIAESETLTRYEALATEALGDGIPGSSAAGEFPKFITARALAGARTPHVIVKFSGADDSRTARRWADLLVCEHLALACAAQMPGIESARSRLLVGGRRTFLEVECFDRVGEKGRLPVLSLEALSVALTGAAGNWPKQATALQAGGFLSAEETRRITLLHHFGRLIANSDMHAGNLGFFPGLRLAPVYDMLPMAYAPQANGEIPPVDFAPVLPADNVPDIPPTAQAAALDFWQQASEDPRISTEFRAICGENRTRLATVL
jgi:hypothetical protein